MQPISYQEMMISTNQAEQLAYQYFNIQGTANKLDGELDFNFKVTTIDGDAYILKVSRPDVDESYIDFQNTLLQHIYNTSPNLPSPKIIHNTDGLALTTISDEYGRKRLVRLVSWISGRLWSSVHPIDDGLMYSLGEELGKVGAALQGFDHDMSHRTFDWNIDQCLWIKDYLHLFKGEKLNIISHFIKQFENNYGSFSKLRKSIIHNDANDNNILVSVSLDTPRVVAIIDYGDAAYSTSINDIAVAIAYAIMSKPDPLAAACQIVRGYHQFFALEEKELDFLHLAVAMRLLISVTKSAINKVKEPENLYLQISEKPAWELLQKWTNLSESLAGYSFRHACGYSPHPETDAFIDWAKLQQVNIQVVFPSLDIEKMRSIDMSVDSQWLGLRHEYEDDDLMAFRLKQWSKKHPKTIPANGYLETRPFYSTDAYKKEGNNGPQYRTMHLGIDFWVPGGTPLHSPLEGTVFSVYNNDHHKDYGPTIILKHEYSAGKFIYSLYGHLSQSTLSYVQVGEQIKRGQQIGFIGHYEENGHWNPHLHFQFVLDLLGNVHDFNGVAFPEEVDIWKSICPDPAFIFDQNIATSKAMVPMADTLANRKSVLGSSLSLSYQNPLKMVRGEGAYLIDDSGRKYLDTVNNVAHVGHQNPRVVEATRNQAALLNTNTRYLHDTIQQLATALLNTMPPELSVVHFVNSGSEANELALRMAYTYTGQKDMAAIQVGYHGNTNSCIAVSDYKFSGKGGKGCPKDTHLLPLPDTFRGIYQGDGSGLKYASHIEDIIEKVRMGDRKIAGFIHESIISCGGQITLPKHFLSAVYDAIRSENGLCIADEVQTGCGRVGDHWWAFQAHDVVPDIVTIGKPLGNGHPLAAVVCTKEVATSFANGMEFFNTFGGNAVSCAIGLEVLNIVEDEGLLAHARHIGHYITKELQMLSRDFPILGDIRGSGLFLGIELVDSHQRPLADHTSYLINRMKENGILMSSDGPDHNVLKIKPPMVFGMENADELLSRLRQILSEDFMQSFV